MKSGSGFSCFLFLIVFHISFNDALWRRLCKLSNGCKAFQTGSSELYIPNRNYSGSWDNYKLPTSATNSIRNTLLTSSVSISTVFPAYAAASIAEANPKQSNFWQLWDCILLFTFLKYAAASLAREDQFAYLGGEKSEYEPLKISRIINGMWQVFL